MAILKMTRAVRQQVYTADLAFALVTGLYSDSTIPWKGKAVLKRIYTRLDNIHRILYRGGNFVLSPRDFKKYNRVILSIKKIILDITENNRVGNDFINAVLMMVEDTRESVKDSNNKKLQYEWNMLNQSLATFYKHIVQEPEPFNPEFTGYKYERLGVALGQKFQKVIMQ